MTIWVHGPLGLVILKEWAGEFIESGDYRV